MKSFSLVAKFTIVLAIVLIVQAQLPTFTYNLTAESADERRSICAQNLAYCTSNCGGIDQSPMNFCNITTMAWGCGCKAKIPDYEGYEWPVNSAHCRKSGEACKTACKIDNTCIAACNDAWLSKCGTPQQPIAYYKTDDPNTVPSYTTPSTKNSSTNASGGSGKNGTSSGTGGNSTGNSTGKASSAAAQLGVAYSLGSAISALAIVAAGMMML